MNTLLRNAVIGIASLVASSAFAGPVPADDSLVISAGRDGGARAEFFTLLIAEPSDGNVEITGGLPSVEIDASEPSVQDGAVQWLPNAPAGGDITAQLPVDDGDTDVLGFVAAGDGEWLPTLPINQNTGSRSHYSAALVPLPAAVWFGLAGLLGVAMIRRWKSAFA
jgi:hypothetical protein